MSEVGSWIVRLEAELARELGQPVTAAAGGEAPDPAQSLVCFLNLPGSRVTLAADAQGIARLLVEGRVIEPDSVDQGLVQELWTGILGSVAARMGGTATTEGSPRSFPTHPCRLQLGETAVRMAKPAAKARLPGRPRRMDGADTSCFWKWSWRRWCALAQGAWSCATCSSWDRAMWWRWTGRSATPWI